MKKDTKREFIRAEVLEILGIAYVSPHAPPDGTTWDKPRCGDCFCTDRSVHTHATMSYLETAERLITFIENL